MTELSSFLAHALALESQAAERYQELARMMDAAGNVETAALFGKMSEFSEMHAGEVRRMAALNGRLPVLRPDQYRWDEPEPPEVGDAAKVDSAMSPLQALHFALLNEERGRRYYSDASLISPDEKTRETAAEFALEEAEHVRTLKKWIRWLGEAEAQPQPVIEG